MNSDIQSKLAFYALATKTLVVGTITNEETGAIDTIGTSGLSLALLADRVMLVGDPLTYKFQDSADGSTDWQDLPEEANLPYSAEGAVVIPVVGETQTIGCFSNRRFVRAVFNGTVAVTNIVLSLPYVLEVDTQENDRYITGGLPGDALP